MIKEKTTQDLMDDWVRALRSGEHEQIEGFLYTEEGKCCLGVLGNIAELPFERYYEEPDVFGIEDCIALLPDEYAKRFGLNKYKTDEDDERLLELVKVPVPGSTRQAGLSYLNDNGWTFAEIADVIEAMGWDRL